MKNSTHRSDAPVASWLTLLAVLSLAALPSCSSPQTAGHSSDSAVVTGGLLPPQLTTNGTSSSPNNSGSRFVVVNPNQHATLRVDYVRFMPDQGRSITSRTDVPPGGSAEIGSRTMNGTHCTYMLTGWAKTHAMESVAKAKSHHAPVLAAATD